MPVYLLDETLVFPPPERAEPDGLLAIGGDLRTERLRLAYRSGIFPWYAEGWPIAWYCSDPRMVLAPGGVRVNKSLRRTLRAAPVRITCDRAFAEVVAACAKVTRRGEEGTWITADMVCAYTALHREGDAHSIEAWEGGALVGGLYGVATGTCFCGESMFLRRSGASKIAFVALCRWLERWGYTLVDCQMPTPLLAMLGGVTCPRPRFLADRARAAAPTPGAGAWDTGEEITAADLLA